jgi:hypothetical protein
VNDEERFPEAPSYAGAEVDQASYVEPPHGGDTYSEPPPSALERAEAGEPPAPIERARPEPEPEAVPEAGPVASEPEVEPDDGRPKRTGWWNRKASFF